MTVSGLGVLINLTNYRGGEQGTMKGLKENELYSEVSSILMSRVAHQTVATLLLTPQHAVTAVAVILSS